MKGGRGGRRMAKVEAGRGKGRGKGRGREKARGAGRQGRQR